MDVEGLLAEFVDQIFVEADETAFVRGGEERRRGSPTGKFRSLFAWRKGVLVGMTALI